jgi:hypothetical protein
MAIFLYENSILRAWTKCTFGSVPSAIPVKIYTSQGVLVLEIIHAAFAHDHPPAVESALCPIHAFLNTARTGDHPVRVIRWASAG